MKGTKHLHSPPPHPPPDTTPHHPNAAILSLPPSSTLPPPHSPLPTEPHPHHSPKKTITFDAVNLASRVLHTPSPSPSQTPLAPCHTPPPHPLPPSHHPHCASPLMSLSVCFPHFPSFTTPSPLSAHLPNSPFTRAAPPLPPPPPPQSLLLVFSPHFPFTKHSPPPIPLPTTNPPPPRKCSTRSLKASLFLTRVFLDAGLCIYLFQRSPLCVYYLRSRESKKKQKKTKKPKEKERMGVVSLSRGERGGGREVGERGGERKES